MKAKRGGVHHVIYGCGEEHNFHSSSECGQEGACEWKLAGRIHSPSYYQTKDTAEKAHAVAFKHGA